MGDKGVVALVERAADNPATTASTTTVLRATMIRERRHGRWIRFNQFAGTIQPQSQWVRRVATHRIDAPKRCHWPVQRCLRRSEQLDTRGVELFFQILTERVEKSSVALTSNLPFSEWGQVITDPRLVAAIVDRMTFRAHIIETGTESFRLRTSRREKS